MPVSRGYPAWFILPEDITDANSEISKAIKKIKL